MWIFSTSFGVHQTFYLISGAANQAVMQLLPNAFQVEGERGIGSVKATFLGLFSTNLLELKKILDLILELKFRFLILKRQRCKWWRRILQLRAWGYLEPSWIWVQLRVVPTFWSSYFKVLFCMLYITICLTAPLSLTFP